jgi:hypothetical protein
MEYRNSRFTDLPYGAVVKSARVGARAGGNEHVERWEQRYRYYALTRAVGTTTTMQLGNEQPTVPDTQTHFDGRFGRPKQMVYPRSLVDGQAVSSYIAYSDHRYREHEAAIGRNAAADDV